jgi:hypothetical protein
MTANAIRLHFSGVRVSAVADLAIFLDRLPPNPKRRAVRFFDCVAASHQSCPLNAVARDAAVDPVAAAGLDGDFDVAS